MRLAHLIVGMALTMLFAGTAKASEPNILAPCSDGVRFTCTDLSIPSFDGTILDATLYLPIDRVPAPVVLYSSDFACSHRDNTHYRIQRRFAEASYVVLAFTPRGFGRSGGLSEVASPSHEVKDVSWLISWAAEAANTGGAVLMDGAGDPRVGLAGTSYGGGIAMLTAGLDPGQRVDALAVQDAWYDFRYSFAPNGVTKTDLLTKIAAAGSAAGALGTICGENPNAVAPGPGGVTPDFGVLATGMSASNDNFAPPAGYSDGTPDSFAFLERRSPVGPVDGTRIIDRVTAPALVFQGQHDQLFFTNEAIAAVEAIAASPRPVRTRLVFYSQDHFHTRLAGEQQVVDALRVAWFDRYLRETAHRSPPPPTGVYMWQPWIRDGAGNPTVNLAAIEKLPSATTDAGLDRTEATIENPSVDTQGATIAAEFRATSLPEATVIAGIPQLRFTLTTPARDAILFATLYDRDPAGTLTRLGDLLTPVRVRGGKGDFCTTALPGPSTGLPLGRVSVCLPLTGTFWRLGPGHTLVLEVATQETTRREQGERDFGYPSSAETATYLLNDVSLQLPTIDESRLKPVDLESVG